ncbi:potassium channel AKT2/3-like [Papaver somniferum]|uniref:potassium channel AKT2/3-like n=1 Tax=Papaver somniferum TaxID=3469 RepID=UPI000E6FEB04|nr:potassium channel AKT2/3-like [Papaver somniferum]XP_026437959.1 potassium channel AKT2/3-like [Papaver somniferum]
MKSQNRRTEEDILCTDKMMKCCVNKNYQLEEGLSSSTALDICKLSNLVNPPQSVPSSSTNVHNNQTIKYNGKRTITPVDCRYRCWETLMAILVAYSVWVYPFELAFMIKSSPHATLKRLLYISEYIVDAFFAIEIVLTFFVAYVDPNTQFLVCDARKIALRYLKTWFLMDIASTVPFGLIVYMCTDRHKLGLFYQSVFGMLRFWRLRKVTRLFRRLEKDIRFNYVLIRCIKLVLVTLFFSHIAGCVYYILADTYPHSRKTWIGSVNPNFREGHVFDRYIASIYWSMSTMTSVGYGDVHSMNSREMTFNIVYMMFNLGLSAYLIGNISTLILEGTRTTMEFRNRIQSASEFVSRNQLPKILKEQILTYMCFRFTAENLNQQRIMDELPNPICKSICEHLFLPAVQNVYLFKYISTETLLLLVAKMRAEYIPPGEDVITKDEAPEIIYIIMSGEVEVINCEDGEEQTTKTLVSGDIVGEVAAFCGKPQSLTFRAKTMSQLLKLKTSSLIETMQTKPDDHQLILQNFREKEMVDHRMTGL